MFNKVLIAEDIENSSLGVIKILEESQITNIDCVYYCDDAWQKITKAKQENEPYDLLITDLSFIEDYRTQTLKNGADLIQIIRQTDNKLNILVFSGENRPWIIGELFDYYNINGYVSKGRADAKELKLALKTIMNGEIYLAHTMRNAIRENNNYEFSKFDEKILNLLASGLSQKEISIHLKEIHFTPSSLSSVEKRIGMLKVILNVSNNQQLILLAKDLGVVS